MLGEPLPLVAPLHYENIDGARDLVSGNGRFSFFWGLIRVPKDNQRNQRACSGSMRVHFI
jgi:hypothetical protein